jgi:hypothetical protein
MRKRRYEMLLPLKYNDGRPVEMPRFMRRAKNSYPALTRCLSIPAGLKACGLAPVG